MMLEETKRYRSIFERVTKIKILRARRGTGSMRGIMTFTVSLKDPMVRAFADTFYGKDKNNHRINDLEIKFLGNRYEECQQTSFDVEYAELERKECSEAVPIEQHFTPGSIIPLSPESVIIPVLPAQVHVVAYGRYEDYRVAAVFTTKEKAEAYADAQNKYWKEKGNFDFRDELYYDDTLDLDPLPSP